jgi:hypothetical protein
MPVFPLVFRSELKCAHGVTGAFTGKDRLTKPAYELSERGLAETETDFGSYGG